MRLAVVSSKGGVGKTAVAVGLAAALARLRRRVLLVDADPQGNATTALGVDPQATLADVLIDGAPLAEVIVEARPGLELVPGDRRVAALEGWLYEDPGHRRLALRRVLDTLEARDVLLVDTAPGHSLTNVCVYCAVDGLIVPASPDGLALHGVRGVEENCEALRAAGLPCPTIQLAVPTFADRRHGRTAVVLDALRLHYRERVTPSVRVCSAVAVAMANGRTVYEQSAKATAVDDLDAVAGRVLALGAA